MQKKRQLATDSEVLCRTSAFQGRSLVLSQFHVLGVESLGLQSRRSRWSLASFLGKARCPAEDPRAGPTLASLLHNKTPSICGPAVAPKAPEVSCWKRRRLAYLTLPALGRRRLPKATTPRGKRLTAFSVAYASLRMQFAAHRSGKRSGARPITLSPIHPIGEKFKKSTCQIHRDGV